MSSRTTRNRNSNISASPRVGRFALIGICLIVFVAGAVWLKQRNAAPQTGSASQPLEAASSTPAQASSPAASGAAETTASDRATVGGSKAGVATPRAADRATRIIAKPVHRKLSESQKAELAKRLPEFARRPRLTAKLTPAAELKPKAEPDGSASQAAPSSAVPAASPSEDVKSAVAAAPSLPAAESRERRERDERRRAASKDKDHDAARDSKAAKANLPDASAASKEDAPSPVTVTPKPKNLTQALTLSGKAAVKTADAEEEGEEDEEEAQVQINHERANMAPELSQFVSAPPGEFRGDLRDLPQEMTDKERQLFISRPELDEEMVPKNKQPLPGAPAPLPALPDVPLAPMPAPITSFKGLQRIPNGAGWPPDTVGDVGPTHYIQAVNTSVGIFNKTTGAAISTFTFNSLFSGAGTGTPCDTSHQGDPTVIYDPMSQRWMVADFAWTNTQNGPYYECVAVSKTSDPVTGGCRDALLQGHLNQNQGAESSLAFYLSLAELSRGT